MIVSRSDASTENSGFIIFSFHPLCDMKRERRKTAFGRMRGWYRATPMAQEHETTCLRAGNEKARYFRRKQPSSSPARMGRRL